MPSDGVSTAPSVNQVWVFLAIVIVISGLVVYLVGSVMDNPDAAILSVLVPSLVAVGFTARDGRWGAVLQLLRLGGNRSTSLSMVLSAVLTVPLLALIAIGIGTLVTDNSYEFALPSDGLIVLLPLMIVALGEEYGWRGFALPGLQTRYSALVAGLMVGAVHWIWHYPPSLIGTGVPLETPFWLFGLWAAGFSVIITALFNASGGAVGLAILFHFSSNVAFQLPVLPEHTGGDLTTYSIFIGLVGATAGFLIWRLGPANLARATRT